MPDSLFFDVEDCLDLEQVATISQAKLAGGSRGGNSVRGCAPLNAGGAGMVAFFSDRRYLAQLKRTEAEFVLVAEAHADDVPEGCIALISNNPQASWTRLASYMYRVRTHEGTAPIHPEAHIEPGVSLGIGVVIGQGAQIGSGTRIEAYAVIGPGVRIGRDCRIGAHSTIYCALIGDKVELASGARIGEAGFGISGDAEGLVAIPQLGRVILQDRVSVGAGTCIDRGTYEDTIVGEATKIDNLVQIAHNTRIGRNCILAAHTGISGSVRIGDGAMFGGRAGLIDHIKVGAGARIGAGAVVTKDVPAQTMVAGFPAKPSRQYMREVIWLEKNAASKDRT